MKIALISDTHDHTSRLGAALDAFAQRGAQALVHAGDMTAPATARTLLAFDGAIRATFGNCDGQRAGLNSVLAGAIAPPPYTFELAGRTFVLAHSISQIPDSLLATAEVAIVGHTHIPSQTRSNGTLIINPGECCGRTTNQATVALLDSADLSLEVINLP